MHEREAMRSAGDLNKETGKKYSILESLEEESHAKQPYRPITYAHRRYQRSNKEGVEEKGRTANRRGAQGGGRGGGAEDVGQLRGASRVGR